jgi:cellulose synthase operon protein C
MRTARLAAATVLASLMLAGGPAGGTPLGIEGERGGLFDHPHARADEAMFAPVVQALAAGDLELARVQLEPLRQRQPDHPGVFELDGTIALAAGDSGRAVTALRRAAALAPLEPTILAKLGLALVTAGDTKQARQHLERAVALAPAHELGRRVLGRLAATAGDTEEALKHYRAGLGEGFSPTHRDLAELLLAKGRLEELRVLLEPLSGPGNPEPDLLLLRAALAASDPGRARVRLETAHRHGVAQRDAKLYSAVIDRMQGNFEAAATALRELYDLHPNSPLLVYELAITEAARGRRQVSGDLATRAADLLPGDHSLRAQLAELLLGVGDTTRALEVLEPYGTAAPAPEAMVQAVRVAFRSGKTDQALALSRRLLATAPEYVPAYQLRAQLLQLAGQAAQAREITAAATRRWPQLPDLWVNRVGLLLQQGELESAARVLAEAARHHDEHPLLDFQRATLAEQQGDAQRAERLYTKLLSAQASRLPSLINLALLLARDPARLDEALVHAREAQRLAPDNPAAQATLGWLQHLGGDSRGAVRLLESAYAVAPKDPNITCRLALVRAATNTETARPLLQACLALKPSEALEADVRARLARAR